MKKIVSGGQTGVDRAALDAAMSLAIPVGGWCPRGRRALDGVIPAHYPLTETRGKAYQTRTKWNVRDSDATLILCHGEPGGGTALTLSCCQALSKPCFVWRLHEAGDASLQELLQWLSVRRVAVLNVAGPRERKACPVYRQAYLLLTELFRQWQQQPGHGRAFVGTAVLRGTADE
ncbi:MAG: hypothetical protein COW18_00560 [Zetaproteobacteria bacterium CG12_big_fil_rev_8_21_14_0_65_54_13]|nr:MAG: hypothetical protein COW18_00560 [Zetaproteobacteria bacterium CG12_big_fil_rev_8_21_14_0_65_54_13]PIX53646.1 MAG: hypothetical protein COZ50_12275 [Zetaproteobacteria bacterium CG_4_10_14_3_um_filter_54_28]PJA27896.1 MAG: hypothetical protein CO188_11085 [Zetaproteobacteria bacterium CG_4_9_14_3_um_filter_54_145]